ncbi:transposase, partial [Enterococcus avium]
DYLLSIDEHLRTSYDVYQNLLDAFDTKDYKDFYERIDHLPTMLDPAFKKAVLYLNKHKQAIINALKYPYSNGKLEGKNNLIKVIKRVAFGFRTFRHLRMRILIQQNLCDII